MKCSQCGKVLSLTQSRSRKRSGGNRIGEAWPTYGNRVNRTITIKCRFCGAVNVIGDDLLSVAQVESEAPESAPVMTRELMRQNILAALKRLHPRYYGYNGGHLAPVRDPDPDLFMSVLTELEREGIIEYNDTQIALRLKPKFMESHQERA